MKLEYLNKRIIGSDETGVGDYMTPLVAAACFVPPKYIKTLLNLGITDSKKLTDTKILELFEKIKPMIKSSVRTLSQQGYNKLNTSFNAHELKTLLHVQAIRSVEERVKNIDLVIIDQYADEKNFLKYLNKLQNSSLDLKSFNAKFILIPKGEMEHVSVAAASIVARAYFIKMMESQDKAWKMHFLLGTNDKVEEVAKEFIKKYGKEKLSLVAKMSFKTTKKIIG